MSAVALEVGPARAIRRAVLDYCEGWLEGNTKRLMKALHPGLAKRSLKDGELFDVTAAHIVAATAAGIGRERDLPDREIAIEIVAIDGPIATAVVRSAIYLEYVHLARFEDEWKIVNTLWRRAA